MKQILLFCFSIGFLKAQMNEIKIGQQVWTAENLNVDKFRNGDPIPEAKTDEEWENAGNNKQAAWCYFDNDPSNGIKYGKLYNWYAVNDPRGLAPLGCHIPSDQEWTDLTTYLGGEEQAGAKMKSKEGLNYNSNGTNQLALKVFQAATAVTKVHSTKLAASVSGGVLQSTIQTMPGPAT